MGVNLAAPDVEEQFHVHTCAQHTSWPLSSGQCPVGNHNERTGLSSCHPSFSFVLSNDLGSLVPGNNT